MWMEKTYWKGRKHKEEGELALGKALISPQRDRGNSDIYRNMRIIKKGDLVFHLVDNKEIIGVSKVIQEYGVNPNFIFNREWGNDTGAVPGYIVKLDNYIQLIMPINRKDILNDRFKEKLLSIRASERNLFYNNVLNLTQGGYLTAVPEELGKIFMDIYFENTGENIPYLTGTSDPYGKENANIAIIGPTSPSIIEEFIIELSNNEQIEFDWTYKHHEDKLELLRKNIPFWFYFYMLKSRNGSMLIEYRGKVTDFEYDEDGLYEDDNKNYRGNYIIDKIEKIIPPRSPASFKLFDEEGTAHNVASRMRSPDASFLYVLNEPVRAQIESKHLVYKIAWHPGDYKGGFCNDANTQVCNAFKYIKENRESNPCKDDVYHCVDEHSAFSDDIWKVNIHPPQWKSLNDLVEGSSLVFLISPLTISKTRYRIVGYYTIGKKIIENDKITGFIADKTYSSKFYFEEDKLDLSNLETKNLFNIDNWQNWITYSFIGTETALEVLEHIYDLHNNIANEITDTDVNLIAMDKTITRLKGKTVEKQEPLDEVGNILTYHLLAGKNIVLVGVPGTGKTRLAKKVALKYCGKPTEKENYDIVTANAEWSAYDVIGGEVISGSEGLNTDFRMGFLTKAAIADKKPHWVIIDELNRANIDLAFGKAFTLLDVEHREKNPLVSKSDYSKALSLKDDIFMPLTFRVLATMNSYDRAALFSLGYAFRRRFAFIELPSPYKKVEENGYSSDSQKQWVELQKYIMAYDQVSEEIDRWIKAESDIKSREFNSNQPTLEEKIKEVWTEIREQNWNPAILVNTIVGWITEKDMVDMGYAQTVDSIKFLLIFLSFEGVNFLNSLKAVDQAFLAYILPQLEYFLPKIRRESITKEKSEHKEMEKITELRDLLSELGLVQSSGKIQQVIRRLTDFGEASIY